MEHLSQRARRTSPCTSPASSLKGKRSTRSPYFFSPGGFQQSWPLFSLIFWVQAACVLHLCCWGGRKRSWPLFIPTFFCFLLVQAVSVEAKLAIFYFWNTPGAEILFALLFWHDKKEYIYKYIFFLIYIFFYNFFFFLFWSRRLPRKRSWPLFSLSFYVYCISPNWSQPLQETGNRYLNQNLTDASRKIGKAT